jgi:hypothetical protein
LHNLFANVAVTASDEYHTLFLVARYLLFVLR